MTSDERRPALAVAALWIACGAALRIHGFADHALWIDEYGTAWAIAGDDFAELWRRVTSVHGQSPFYYALVRVSTTLLGDGVAGLRLPSLVSGVGLLLVALPLARRLLRDDRAAAAAVAAFALNERLVYYSQEARPYALALLLVAVAFWCFARLWEDPRSRVRQLAWVLSVAAAFYAHYLFVLAIAAQLLYLLWRRPRRRAEWRPWLEAGLALALLCAPALGQLASLSDRRASLDWVGSAGPGLLRVLAGYLDPPVLAASALAVAACALASRGLRLPWRARPAGSGRAGMPGLVGLWLLVPFAGIALASLGLDVNLVHPRYLLASLPPVALLYGLGLSLPASRGVAGWLPLAVFACAVGLLRLAPQYESNGLFSQRRTLERWDLASRALLERHRPGDPIFYQTKFVELDAVVRGEASPRVADFTRWPVAAHLPEARRASLRALPAGRGAEQTRALRARLDEAARAPRSFVVLSADSLERVLSEVRRRPDVALAGQRRFGVVYVLWLRGAVE